LFRCDIEADLLPYAAAHHIGVLAYGPLAHGLLGGTITETTAFGGGDWRSHSPAFTGPGFRRNLEVVAALHRFAADRGATIGAIGGGLGPGPSGRPRRHRRRPHPRPPRRKRRRRRTAPEPGDLAEIDRIMAAAVPVGGRPPKA
jgi:hypothetical protein